MNQIPRILKPGMLAVCTLSMAGLVMACGTPSPSTPMAQAEKIIEIAETPSPKLVAVVSPTALSTPTTAPSPTSSATPTTVPSPTSSPTPTTVPSPTVAPSPTSSPTVVISNDSCIQCHTDKEQLIATAKEEEVVEQLSEGEG